MATQAEFELAATQVGRAMEWVGEQADRFARDPETLPMSGGAETDNVIAEFSDICHAARVLVNELDSLIGELSDRAFQCAVYSREVYLYRVHLEVWEATPPETRGDPPTYPQPTAPWMEAS